MELDVTRGHLNGEGSLNLIIEFFFVQSVIPVWIGLWIAVYQVSQMVRWRSRWYFGLVVGTSQVGSGLVSSLYLHEPSRPEPKC